MRFGGFVGRTHNFSTLARVRFHEKSVYSFVANTTAFSLHLYFLSSIFIKSFLSIIAILILKKVKMKK
jgi:hypothetical protein